MIVRILNRLDHLLRPCQDGVTAAKSANRLHAVALEERILFSAVPLPQLDAPPEPGDEPDTDSSGSFHQDSHGNPVDQPDIVHAPTADTVDDTHANTADFELVFVDDRVEGLQTLLTDLANNSDPDRILEVVLLDSSQDGVEQISQTLAEYSNVSALHLISHGADGQIRLGNTVLSSANLAGYAGQIAGWAGALSTDADLLIYGCDVAQDEGRLLVDSLAALTGADVAANEDATGHVELGGDWSFEYQVGLVESTAVLSADFQSQWEYRLAVYTVTNTLDDGNVGSLRWAIAQSNASLGADTIEFNIAGGGTQVIALSSALDTVTDTVFIDGTTQTGWTEGSFLPIVVDGNDGSFSGLTFSATADNSEVRGLVIRDVGGDAIEIADGASGITIAGNWIGQFNSDGSDAGSGETLGGNGIFIDGDNNTIGGTTTADRNVINERIYLYSTSAHDNVIAGNYLGTDITGNSVLASGGAWQGVVATNSAHHNTIGGATDAHRNIISGSFAGIDIEDASTSNFTIQNNWIGLGADGSSVLGSGNFGIYLLDGDNHLIGGVGTGNVILGSGVGIGFIGGVDGTTVQGNFIGIDETGSVVAGNDVGIEINWGSSGNMIGGVSAGEGNVITASSGAGIAVLSSSNPVNNSIRGNAIFDNDGLGIDLHGDGVTVNDAGDSDTGANNLQNWAVLKWATIADDGTFDFQLDTTTLALGTYTVDFYASTDRDGGQVEGKRYLGTHTGIPSGGTVTSSLSGVTLAPGEYITLITTDASGNSSEFSNYAVATDSDAGGTTPNDLLAIATSEGGLAINADGGNDTYLQADDGGGILGGLTDFTVEIQLAIGSPLTDTPLISYATAGAENEVMLWLNGSGTLQLKINDYSGNASTVSSTATSADFDDGMPHTISATWSSAAGDWVIYLDGVDIGSGTGFATGHTIESGGSLIFGQDQDSVGGGFNSAQHFAGTYYDVRVFNDVRTANEIAASYRSDLPYDEAGMIANWKFEQLSSDGVVIDAVSGNNLTVKHVTAPGFTANDPRLKFALSENALDGTVVGQVSGADAEREAKIASLLAADPDLRYNAETGSFYKIVPSGAMDKNAALSIVSSTTLNGVVGTLPTITSANENEYLRQLVSLTGTTSAWLSGSDAAVADEWRWADGTLFWKGGVDGYRVGGQYVNFSATEPDGGTNTTLTSLSLSGSTGEWKDSSAFLLNTGLIIEYNADEVLDATNALTYSIQSQTVAGAFTINSSTGEITVADGSLLDYETNATHTVTVRSTDVDGNTYDEAFTISLNNLAESNNAPTNLSSGIELNTDGGNDAYLITTNAQTLLGGAPSVTLEISFAGERDAGNTSYVLFSYETSTQGNALSVYVADSGDIGVNVSNSLTLFSGADYASLLLDGRQHHIALSWDNSSGDLRLYVDGELMQTAAGVQTGNTLSSSATSAIVLGNDQDGVNTAYDPTAEFKGTLYDVRIWNDVRSETEIALNYQHKFDSGSVPSGLVANWQMDGFNGSNEVVDVVSGNNLSIGHAAGAGFVASTPVEDLHISENAVGGTSVGFVVPSDPDAPQDIVVNGSFRDGYPGSVVNSPNSFGGWTVTQGNVNVFNNWDPGPLGGYAIDLNGNVTQGAIQQTLTTEVGRQYQVVFALSGDWTSGEAIKDVRVSAGGQSTDFSIAMPTGWNASTNMMWSDRSMTFTADSTSTALSFASMDGPDAYGAAITDVRVIEIPHAVSTILNNDPTLSYDAATGKFYRFETATATWTDAQAAAAAATINGVSGQLVTIRSAYENQVIRELTDAPGVRPWIGATDQTVEGEWRWQDNGTDDDQFWQGDGTTGNAISGQYSNWYSNNPQASTAPDDYAIMLADGQWADRTATDTQSYVIEWDASEVLSSFTFSLTDDAGGRFAIDSSTGEITVADGSLIDYETATSHNVTVEVTDSAGNTYSEVMTIAIDNQVDANQSVPGAQSVDEDSVLTFSTANGNAVSVSDSLGGTNSRMRVTLSVNDGVLTLSQTTGLTLVEGVNGSGSLVIDGTESDINAALEGMTFTPDADFNGSVNLNMTTSLGASLDGHYTFEGGNAIDQSVGISQNGTFNGNATTVIDPERGEVLSLDGNGDYVQVSGLYGEPTDVTLAAWVDLTGVDTGGAVVISMGGSPALYFDSSGQLLGFYESGGANYIATFSNSLIGAGWSHVAMTIDSSSQELSLFVNGELVETVAAANPIEYDNGPDTYIGRHGEGVTGFDLNGLIDDARVYTRALSADEIAALAADQTEATGSVAITVNAVNDAPTLTTAIEIDNHSFEWDVLATDGQAINTGIKGWTKTGANTGVWNATSAAFPAEAPDGANVAYIDEGGTISQTTSAVFSAGTDYSLTVAVGDELDPSDPNAWAIRLYAGTQLLGSVTHADFDPANGTFPDATLTLTADQLNAFSAFYGENIRVELYDSGASANIQFDNVRLTQTSSDITTESVDFVEGGSAVVLNRDVQIFDAELSAANNFAGSTLTLARNGGASSEDVFNATGTLSSISAASGNVVVGGTTIGTYTNSGGTLVFTFNGNATNSLVNQAMQQIAYANSSDAPPANVQIDWTFDDGNTSDSQGTGGALQATGSTAVTIHAAADLAIAAPATASTNEDTALVYSGANVVSIDDGIAADTRIQVSLSVGNGTLTLASLTGIDVVVGSDGSATMVIEGLVSAINTALDGLTFTPNADFNGADTLNISTSLAADLQGHYTFEGGNANDQSTGTVQNGVFVGNATTVIDAERGEVLSLDGDGDYVEINSLFGSPSSVTLATWFNLSSYDVSGSKVISLGENVLIWLSSWNDTVRGSFYDGTAWHDTSVPGLTASLPGSGWNHIAYTIDDATNTQTLYLNGVAIATTNHTETVQYTSFTTTRIGAHAGTSIYRDFNGLIDDVRIYDRSLSADEIAALATDQTEASDSVAITVNSVNDAPSLVNLDGNPTFVEGGSAVILDSNVTISDAELSAANNFNGSTLTLSRNGGANSDDALAFDGTNVTTSGANVLVSGVTVGTYTFTGGELTITFNSNATQARVNTAAQNIVYWNSSDVPPASLQIDWTFNDQNSASAQGSGGALTATGSTTVNITATNDAPTFTTLPNSVSTSFSAGGNDLLSIGSGDFDGDGDNDLVTGNLLGDIRIATNDGTGIFTDAGLILDTAGEIESLKVVDIDGDADLDIIAVSYDVFNTNPAVHVLTNDGTGSFTVVSMETAFLGADDIAFGDLDNDGDIDIAATFWTGGEVAWYENMGAGSWTKQSIDQAFGAISVEIADMNGDGFNDLVVGARNLNEVVLFTNDGVADPTFTRSTAGTVSNAFFVSTADLDGDGDLDIAYQGMTGVTGWLENDGTASPTFTDHFLADYGTTRHINTNDFDNDGDQDLFVAHYGGSELLLWTNDGTGMFTESVVDTSATNIRRIEFGDIDGDGDNDFLTVRQGSSTVHIYENSGSGPFRVTTNEFTTVAIPTISIADADAGTNDLQVTITAPNGAVSFSSITGLTFTTGDGNLDSTAVFTGTLADINAALTGLQFTPNQYFNGETYFDITINDQGNTGGPAEQVTQRIYVAVAPINNGPTMLNLSNRSYSEGAPAVILDGDVDVIDVELDALNGGTGNYSGSSLTIGRNGGANAEDLLSFSDGNGITLSGSTLVKNGQTIASFDTTSAAGQLVITFTDANGEIPTSVDVDNILRQITYANSSDAPPASVQIDWTFNDGNTGAQGNGGAQQVTGSTTVNITAVNDAPTFDVGGGVLNHDFASDTDSAYAVTRQDDGKLIVVGEAWNGADQNDFAITRYNSDGTLDTGFGTGGQTTLTLSSGEDVARDVRVQADGKILVAGYSYNGSSNDFTLVRLNADGTPDTGFDGDGVLTTAIGGIYDTAYSMTLQDDGKILLAGRSLAANSDFALVRYNADGSLDTSFDGDGMVTTAIDAGHDTAYDVALQADGKILLTGTDGSNLTVVRYTTDGSLDTGFGGSGIVTTNIGSGHDAGTSIAVQTDGKIVIGGISFNGSNFDIALVRYNVDGTLDGSFGSGGIVGTPIGSNNDWADSIAIQSDGRILVAGSTDNVSHTDVALLRYNSDGSLDATFGSGGIVTTDLGGSDDVGYDMLLQPDGRIVVVGNYTNGSAFDFLMLRYNSDGSLDTDFAPVNTLDGNPTFIEGGAAVVLDADVDVSDAELDALNGGAGNYDGASVTIGRNGGANAEDLLSFSDGNGITLSGSTLVKNGQTIASFDTTSAGQLAITFTDANGEIPTSVDVDNILRQITYANSSDTPPASVQIDWTFNDGNTASAQGSGGALEATGTTTVNITAVNDAPVLDNSGTMTLNTVTEDETNNAGQTVASIIASAGGDRITDVDSGAVEGIAVVNSNGGGAGLQFSTNGGSTWTYFGVVNGSSSLLLRSTDLIRVVPDGQNGASGFIEFRAWDQTGATSGLEGTKVNTNTNGGTTAFSSATETASFTVTAVNDEEVLATNTGTTVAEGSTGTILTTAMVHTTDVDNTDAQLVYTVDTIPANGTLRLNGTALSNGQTFTQDDIDNNRVTYDHNGSQTSADSFDFTVDDGQGTDTSGTFNFTITNVNDPPINTVPGAQTVDEDTSINITGISVADSDDNLSTVQLTVNDGTLNVMLSGGASISAGANGSGDLTLSGSLADVNATLASLTYQGNSNFNGSDTLTVLSTDGDSVTDSDTVSITVNAVNDMPDVVGPGSAYSVNEQTNLNIHGTGFSITDVDAVSGTMTATFTVGEGTLTLSAGDSGVSITANNASNVTFTGTLAQIDALLTGSSTGTIVYNNGSDTPSASTTITLTVNDGGNTGTDPGLTGDASSEADSVSQTINITAVNDIPFVNMATGGETYVENAAPLIVDAAVTVTDADALDFDGGVLTVSLDLNGTANDRLTVLHQGTGAGQVNVVGNAILIDGVQIATFTGGVGDDLLVTFDADAFAVDVEQVARRIAFSNTSDDPSAAIRVVGMQLTDGDGGSSLSDQRIVYFTAVNDEEILATNTGSTVSEASTGNVLTTAMLATTDVDNTPAQLTYTITSGASNGTLRLSGTTLGVSDTFTQADLDAGFVTYDHDGSETVSDSFDFTVDDGAGSSSSGTFSITVSPVNDEEVLATNTGSTVSEGSNGNLLTAAMLQTTDADHAAAQLVYTVDAVPSNGTLYRNGVVLNVSDSFTQADIDANLITYDHDGSQTSSDSFDFTVDDGSGSTTSASFNWMVTNVNDAPVVTVPSTQSVNEDVAIAIGGLSVADDDGNLATVQLTANNGVLNVSLQGGASISAGANGSSLLTVSGSQADINSTLATLGYQGNTNWNGTDTISVLATDGNGLTHADSFDVTVAPVNDAPVLQDGFTMTIAEGPSGVAPLGGKVMTDVDGVDFDGGVLTAQVTTGADGSERLWFASGVHLSNVGSTLYYDATIIGTVSGLWSSGPIVVTFNANATQTEVQEVYSNIAIGIPGDNAAPGDRTLEVTLTDGDGGTSNTSLSTLHVTLVNDDPFNSGSLPTDVAVTEDVSTAIDLSSIDLADPDANSGGLTLKLTAGAGNLTAVAAAGITISGDGTSSLSLTGTLVDLNAYLDGPSNLAYLHPTAHLNGNDADTITIAINDNGNSGNGGGADQTLGVINVDITPVNDEQVLATNTGATVSEGSNNNLLTSAMLQSTDVDHAAVQLIYTVDAVPSNGTLYRNGVALSVSDSFTQADIDANLITYDHDGSETSSDSFDFTVDDGIGSTTSATFNWTVTNVNDAPVLDTTGDMSLTPITEDDVNNNGNSVAEIIASAGGDRITDEDLGSVEGIALRTATTNSGSWQYSLDGGLNWANVGTVADSSALLLRDTDRIRFVPVTDVGGTDSFTFRAWDQTSGSAGTKVSTSNAGADFAFSVNIETVAVSVTDVNDGPQVTAPISAFVVNEQTNLAIHGTGFSVTDVDAQSGTMTASIAVGEGTLVVFAGDSGVTVTSGNGTNQVNITGSLAQINHLLTGAGTGTITYGNASDTPANFTTISVTVNDGGNTGSDPGLTGDGTSEESSASQTINLTAINDAPVNSGGLPSSVTVVEDVDSNVDLSALNLADVDAGGGLLTVTLQTSSGSQLTAAPSVGVTIGGTSTARTITGTLVDLNNYFDDVTKIQYLHGTPQTNGNNADSIIVSVNDNGNTGVGGGTDVVLGVTPVHISAVNDEEVLTTNTGASFLEGSHSNLLTAAMLETLDVDHSTNQIVYSLVAGPAHGQLFLNGSPLISTDTFTQADINAGRVHYNHDGSETTLDSFAFQVDDGVGTSTSASFAISIVPVNDEQVIAVNSVASVAEGATNNVLSAALLQTTDVDDSAANLTYTITANPAQGTLMRSGVVMAVSDSFTQADIDAGLITYDHSGSEATVDSFDFVVDDGVGLISSGTFVWSILPVNDVPVIAAIEAGSLLYMENDGAVAVTSILSLADADDVLLAGARIQIVSNYAGNQDSLLFVNQSGIAGAWNATSGELTLSGSASLAEYTSAIQSVRYVNDSETPSTAVRTIRITVNDGQADASSVTRDILITSVNDLPQAAVDHYLLAASLSTISVNAADGLLANDIDLDGETLRAILVTPPLIGNLTLQADGSFSYDALPGFTGSISFEYAVSDASTQSAPTVVMLEIQGAQTPGVSQPPELNSSPDEIDLDEQDTDDSTEEVGDGQPGVIAFETATTPSSTPTGPGAAKENLDGQFAIVVIAEQESLEYKQSSDRLDEFAIALESNSLAHQRNVFTVGFDSALETELDLDDWDKLLHQFRGTVDQQQDSVHWVTGSASAIFIGVTVGVATWSLSGTYIASLAASSLPAWAQFDPVFVLRHAATVRDEKSLAQIIQERKKRHENR